MEMKQVSDNCFVEKNRVFDANSGLINLAGGVVIDTQSNLAHARQMIEMFSKVWPAMPKRVINTHEDGDHVWGNQLFEGAEIIAHRSVPERMKHVTNPEESQKMLHGVGHLPTRQAQATQVPGINMRDQPQGRRRVRVVGVHGSSQARLRDGLRHHPRLYRP